ncbi:MAG: cellobiose phosphorylase [Candidatus Omnitrophota bacterium]
MAQKQAKYYLNEKGEFIIENYNYAKPFADFFPGIAGKYGIPMWVFYVNRGQAIASFGTKDKDHPILEFYPANKSWQFTTSAGFRTFIKVLGAKDRIYEPFHNGFVNLAFKLNNSMSLTSYDLKLKEMNLTLGLEVRVEYFNIPSDCYAGLARVVRIKNTGRLVKKIQILDGLPQVIPYGINNFFLKKMSRTIEAWTRVENLKNNAPFFRLAVDPADKPEVIHINEGNFYLSFYSVGGKTTMFRPIVNPESIFGQNTDFSSPAKFSSDKKFSIPHEEITESRTPSAFSFMPLSLKAGQEITFNTVLGFMRSLEELNKSISRITAPEYLNLKRIKNKEIIKELQSDIETKSSSKEFNLYAKQTYLDNIMRGGYPQIFKCGLKETVFYLYSRKHGDLERDYNKFLIQPTYFSQGNGNYRDINQNRRNNVWFNPDIKEADLISLLNLIQTDGFNPLIIKGALFILKDKKRLTKELKRFIAGNNTAKLSAFFKKPFSPGEVILFIQDNGIRLNTERDEFLNVLISCCEEIQEADHGEGFWSDHWSYNLDLLESYFGLYPDKLKNILFEINSFTFFDNIEVVKPRSEKYVLYNNLPRQLHSVTADAEKKELIKKRRLYPHLVRKNFGKGEVYRTTLIDKLLCLAVNKLASLDPFGSGMEMEADKPNWYDALNGLPALFGSSVCETFELKRLIIFIKSSLVKSGVNNIELTKEIYNFLIALNRLLSRNTSNYEYWDESHSLKEEYRRITRLGLSGKKTEISASLLLEVLNKALKKINVGLNKVFDRKRKVYYSYFINEITKYDIIKSRFIAPKKFKQIKLPFFLEGQMHALRLSKDINEAVKLADATKKNELFDKKLKMYKVTASLRNMPEEIGRCRIFAPGWLENESIWLHMEYKYMLEMLKCGLYEKFYADFKNVLIPFQDPARYGRSILENSSFLVSSAFADKNLQGNGFVARLSGSTAEFLQIWLLMNLGNYPFFLNKKNELNLRFRPVLAGWLFDKKGIYGFNFLSRINITYFNLSRKDTFGKNSVKIKEIIFKDNSGSTVEIASDTIPSPYAEQIRSRLINKIDIYLK